MAWFKKVSTTEDATFWTSVLDRGVTVKEVFTLSVRPNDRAPDSDDMAVPIPPELELFRASFGVEGPALAVFSPRLRGLGAIRGAVRGVIIRSLWLSIARAAVVVAVAVVPVAVALSI
jgi:hypothetical protein